MVSGRRGPHGTAAVFPVAEEYRTGPGTVQDRSMVVSTALGFGMKHSNATPTTAPVCTKDFIIDFESIRNLLISLPNLHMYYI